MSRKVQVNGAGINVSEWGAGSPVLLLHGNPDSGVMREDVAKQLAGKFHCIAPDLPGFGNSDVPRTFEPSLEGMAQFLEGVRQAMGINMPLDLVA
jgi:pimeloyl-ACP methyl ester carboxylesterase